MKILFSDLSLFVFPAEMGRGHPFNPLEGFGKMALVEKAGFDG